MTAPAENPYPGLRPFESAWSHLFFGREVQVDTLLAGLNRLRFLGVVGTSGSGKSSLVRAGLIPALRRGYLSPAGSGWREVVFRPGLDPLGELSMALVETASKDAAPACRDVGAVRAALDVSSFGLADAIKQSSPAETPNCLIVVDQFEELFRSDASLEASTRDARLDFVQLLLTTVEQATVSAYVVITMRSDYLGECARFQGLPELLNRSQYLVPRMTREQLQDAIEGPLAVEGGTMAPRLVQRLLNEFGDSPDDLPMLQHVLMRLWEISVETRAKGSPIDLEHYTDPRIGGLRSALNVHAEMVLRELNETHQRIARRIFQCLSEKTQTNLAVRRLAGMKELIDAAGPAGGTATDKRTVVESVLEPFERPGRSFVMRTKQGDLDISHESLLRQWTTLRTWVDEEARSRDRYLRVDDAAQRWQDRTRTGVLGRRRAGSLFRGPELAEALVWWQGQEPTSAWARRYERPVPGEKTVDHVAAVDLFLKRSRARRWLWRGVAIAGIVAVIGNIGLWLHRRALEASIREASALLSNATTAMSDNLQTPLSILLTAEAYARDQASAKDALTKVLSARVLETQVIASPATDAIVFSPNGDIACGRVSGVDAAGQPFDGLALTHFPENKLIGNVALSTPASAEVFSPDGRLVAVAGWDGKVHLLSASDGRESRPPPEVGGLLSGVTFSRLGTWLAVSINNGGLDDVDVRVLSTADWRTVSTFARVSVFAFSPDERSILIGDRRGNARLFDVKSGKASALVKESGPLIRVAFNPDGRTFVTGSTDGTVDVRDVAAPQRQLLSFQHNYGQLDQVAFSPQGRYLATASANGELRLTDLMKMQAIALGTTDGVRTFNVDAPILDLAFSPDEQVLAVAASSRSSLIDTATGKALAPLNASERVTAVFFQPQGAWLAVKVGDRIRVLQIRPAGPPPTTDRLLEAACGLAGRAPYLEQLQKYLAGEPLLACRP